MDAIVEVAVKILPARVNPAVAEARTAIAASNNPWIICFPEFA